MNNYVMPLMVGTGLALLQVLAALPWLAALDPRQFFVQARKAQSWLVALIVTVGLGVLIGFFIAQVQDPTRLRFWGRLFGGLLHAQMTVDFFALLFPLMLLVWPHGTAVGLAAFREGVRQPMFWLIGSLALALMLISPFLPYFTFGEDVKMVRELGYDAIMLSAALFGVLAASMSIAEEIEGRTAITVMSKPVSRRQFLVGKFLGIVLAALLMTGVLGWVYNGVVWYKLVFENETIGDPSWLEGARQTFRFMGDAPQNFVLGVGIWFDQAANAIYGMVFGFCQVMVLIAVAVALATRLPMIVNLVTCLMVFFLGHLTQILVPISRGKYPLIEFMAKVFSTVLPGLEYFSFGPVLARDFEPDPRGFAIYTASVVSYAVLYSIIALLLGLILFEDRDLA